MKKTPNTQVRRNVSSGRAAKQASVPPQPAAPDDSGLLGDLAHEIEIVTDEQFFSALDLILQLPRIKLHYISEALYKRTEQVEFRPEQVEVRRLHFRWNIVSRICLKDHYDLRETLSMCVPALSPLN